MTRRTGMLSGGIGRDGITDVAGVCARTIWSAIATRAHTRRVVRRMSIPPGPMQVMVQQIGLMRLDPGRRRMPGRAALVAAAMAVAFVTDPSRALAQEHVVDLVGGAAATGTAAAHQP